MKKEKKVLLTFQRNRTKDGGGKAGVMWWWRRRKRRKIYHWSTVKSEFGSTCLDARRNRWMLLFNFLLSLHLLLLNCELLKYKLEIKLVWTERETDLRVDGQFFICRRVDEAGVSGPFSLFFLFLTNVKMCIL